MTGPEHYLEAQRLLEQADIADARRRNQYRGGTDAYSLREAAQVHATLAVAAAYAAGQWDRTGWMKATLTIPQEEPGWRPATDPVVHDDSGPLA